jgi:hypothetical protein
LVAADVPKSHAFCKEEEQNVRLFGTPLNQALGGSKNAERSFEAKGIHRNVDSELSHCEAQ